ncbi:MAG: sensor signal transduction histidine kinase [Chthonomonadales bacterium]|nr:sensor signal transduction histidine kinase [Chthonomonadales bacterium]
MLLITARGRILRINATGRAIFGIPTNQDLLGKPCMEFIRHEKCMAIIQQHLTSGFQAETADRSEDAHEPVEIFIKTSTGQERLYQMVASNVYDDADTHVGTIFTFKDITDLWNAGCLDPEYLSTVNQGVRWPLIPVKGFVHTLLEDEKEELYDRTTRREFYTIIDENVDRVRRSVMDLLEVSSIEKSWGVSRTWEPNVRLRQISEDILAFQRERTNKHTFVLDFEPEEIEFEAVHDELKNILQNFVSNAIACSPEGGEIRILARLKDADEEFPYDSVLVGVRDQGIGLSTKDIKKIGRKFERADNAETRKGGGTGIGLYLVKALIAAHKGIMTVESELGKGSTFWMRLPLKQPEPESLKETP